MVFGSAARAGGQLGCGWRIVVGCGDACVAEEFLQGFGFEREGFVVRPIGYIACFAPELSCVLQPVLFFQQTMPSKRVWWLGSGGEIDDIKRAHRKLW